MDILIEHYEAERKDGYFMNPDRETLQQKTEKKIKENRYFIVKGR